MVQITHEALEEILQNASKSSNDLEFSLATTKSELQDAAEVVTNAFMDYAMFEWLLEDVKDPQQRRTMVRFIVLIIQRLCVFGGFVVVAKDKSTGKAVGCIQVNHKGKRRGILAAFWMIRFVFYMIFHFFFGAIGFPWFLFRAPVKTFARRGKACQTLDEEHDKVLSPSTEHLHLIQIATDTHTQSKGVGVALLNVLKAVENRYGLATYLETDTERHRNYYERNGFKVETEYVVDAGDGDVFKPNFGMVRNPPNNRVKE